MGTLTQANRQWSSRPADERFVSLTAMHSAVTTARANSTSKVVSSRQLQAVPVEGDSQALMVTGPNGQPVTVSNWSFGQLAARADAPAGYLRKIPAPLAADCINYGLYRNDSEEIGVLLHKGDGVADARAFTGGGYGRVWNSQVTGALVEKFGDGVTGQFKVPGEFGRAVTVTQDNTTLFAGDRDMFVFLADEERRITVPNRRDGRSGELARGFFVWNSEVGSATLGISTFLFDYVCSNRMVWGATDYKEIRIRHTANAGDRWLEEVAPAIEAYASGSAANVQQAIAAAQAARLDNVDEFLLRRFNKSQVSAINAAHLADEGRPIESIWDAATGATAHARSIHWQDARIDIERKAGAMLDLASA